MANRSESHLLQDLDALTQSMYQSQPARRTASLVLPRSAAPPPDALAPPIPAATIDSAPISDHRPRPRRMSMSPFRSRPKSLPNQSSSGGHNQILTVTPEAEEKKGLWSWKPLRALSHIGMQRLGVLFSVEAVAAQGLPASMNGLRLSVAVRKKETKDGTVQTMPARVLQSSADFEETLFIRCHVYCSGGASTGKPLKLEPRPFLVSVVAIDAPELDFGRSTVDLSLLMKESMEKNSEGERVRQWDASFALSGKAKGGELVLKLGFQIMEDGGVGIYNQIERVKSSKGKDPSSPFARRQSKASFSITSPRVTRSEPTSTPSKAISAIDLKGIDDFNLDEPGSPPSFRKPEPEPETKEDDLDLPEFEVLDKGVEIQAREEAQAEPAAAAESEDVPIAKADNESVTSEVVKEMVHDEPPPRDSAQLVRMSELDAIAKQIKALESMMVGNGEGEGEGDGSDPAKPAQEDRVQRLDADEETVTKEFLQMLELEEDDGPKYSIPDLATPVGAEGADGEARCFLSDLGKGLGSVVHTRDGGYLAAMNPLDIEVQRRDTPKLAMQISRPFGLPDQNLSNGLELFQKLGAMGSEELGSKLLSLASMDELMGKTAEQIAFEGMASAIISGRNKDGGGASSTAARSVAELKKFSAAMVEGRRERIVTGIWNVREEPVAAEEILAMALQKVEAMAVEAMRIQARMAEEEAPFDASPLKGTGQILNSAVPLEEWEEAIEGAADAVTLLVVVQLRDPMRRYETVGAPVIAVIQAVKADGGGGEEGRYKVCGLSLGGLKVKSGGRRGSWDGEKQRLTAMQWLVAYGLGKAGKKSRGEGVKGGQDLLWSISSRVMADMWLKHTRNPDVKVPEQ